MILVDANLLVYAHVAEFAQHDRARAWLEQQLSGTRRVGFAWSSLLAFVRLVSNPRVFGEPESVPDAWSQASRWLQARPAWTPQPTEQHQDLLTACLSAGGIGAHDVPDAHLAALALEHGLRLATSDSGFARFPDLTWFDPLDA